MPRRRWNRASDSVSSAYRTVPSPPSPRPTGDVLIRRRRRASGSKRPKRKSRKVTASSSRTSPRRRTRPDGGLARAAVRTMPVAPAAWPEGGLRQTRSKRYKGPPSRSRRQAIRSTGPKIVQGTQVQSWSATWPCASASRMPRSPTDVRARPCCLRDRHVGAWPCFLPRARRRRGLAAGAEVVGHGRWPRRCSVATSLRRVIARRPQRVVGKLGRCSPARLMPNPKVVPSRTDAPAPCATRGGQVRYCTDKAGISTQHRQASFKGRGAQQQAARDASDSVKAKRPPPRASNCRNLAEPTGRRSDRRNPLRRALANDERMSYLRQHTNARSDPRNR